MSTTATELAQSQIVTRDGIVTATVVDRVSPERIMLMLLRGAVAAKYAGYADQTPTVSREIRQLLVDPRPE